MAIVTVAQLKAWFVTNAIPIEDQFSNLFESFRHVNDKLSINDLNDSLKNLLNDQGYTSETNALTSYSKSFDVDVVVEMLRIKPTASATITVQFNGTQFTEVDVEAGKTTIIPTYYCCDVATTVSINNLPINSSIKIYKR